MYDDSHLVASAPLIISKIEPVETADRLRHKCLEVCVDRERERGRGAGDNLLWNLTR